MPLSPALRRHARLPLILAAILLLICAATAWAPPAGRFNWALEVGPGLALMLALAMMYPRLPLSHFVYVGTFLHVLILIYGGYYTYALTPLGNWARDAFHLSRNHYDRVGHVALGVFPAFLTRSVVLAIAAFWELLEWWTTLVTASDVGQAFLGSQGDVWDAQWDMFLALVGALVVLLALGRAHDRSMAKVPVPSYSAPAGRS
jgi:putative membrane protein